MQYLRILSNALGQCTAHTLFRNTHPLLMVMQNTRNSTQHHYTLYNITTHHTTSLHIIQHHYTSYNITAHHTTSLHIIQHHCTSYNITTHHTTSLHIIQHHYTSYNMYMKHIQVNVHVHMTSPSVHTTHSVAGGPKARLGITLNLDGNLMYSIVMYMYMSLQEWDLCTIFTSVVSKVCLLVLNCIGPCHVCQTRGGLNSQ